MALHKFIRLLLAVLLVVATFAACANTAGQQGDTDTPTDSVNELPDTPVRVGEGEGTSYIQNFNLPDTIERCDLIVDLTIDGWIGEDTEMRSVTFFQASANKVYMGEEHESIVLIQDGSSLYTLEGYPLFQKGDRLLLFLVKADDSVEHENAYWISGCYTSIMDIQEHDGHLYILDRDGGLTSELMSEVDLDIADPQIATAVKAQMDLHDPILARNERAHKNIVSYETLTGELATMIEER